MPENEFHINREKGESTELTSEERQALDEIEQFMRETMKDIPEHHGVQHIDSVREIAQKLCEQEKGDLFAIEVSVLLHDVGRRIEKEKNRPHAILSLFEAHNYLKKLYEEGLIDIERWKTISQAIAKHSRLNEETDRLTLDIVRDADRLDGMGLSGILRCIEYAKDQDWPFYESGQEIIVPDDKFMDRESSMSAIGNVNFVRDWKRLLKLESAKKIVQQRLQPMEDFLMLFKKHQEISNYDVWIKFIKYQLKHNKFDVTEEDFQKFLSEYEK